MVRKTKKELYSGVSIPIDIMNQIEDFREKHPEMKYRSRAEFIMDAIREKLTRENWESVNQTIDDTRDLCDYFGVTPDKIRTKNGITYVDNEKAILDVVEKKMNELGKKITSDVVTILGKKGKSAIK